MFGDPWPEEPDEPLVEKYRRDEEDIAPEPPEPPEPDEIPADLRRTFWTLVAAINVGLLATSLGAMLIGFRGEWADGGTLVALGVAAFLWAGYRYRRFKNEEGTRDGKQNRDDPDRKE